MVKNKILIERTSLIEKVLALLLLIILSPFLILLFVISFIDTKKFPIFIQERGLSLSKYRFKMFKFRTMFDEPLSDENIPHLILKKPFYSDKVSNIGRFLRKTGLDELPQFINIIRGEMKFVGPRALSINDLERIRFYYPELYQRRSNLNSMPGIIGLWQVNKDFECSVEKLVQLDEEFERNKSFMLKLKIILKAFKIVFLGYHVDAIVNGKKLKIYPYIVYVTVLSSLIFLFILIN